jgi:N-acetyl-anhydromuramyl-L-alanine amidase AmpD
MTRVARVAAQAVSVGVAAALALGTLALGHHAATVAGHATIAPPRWTDGVAVCRWDARYQGNGLGESFTLTGPN